MRRVIAGLFITLDGVVEAPEKWPPRRGRPLLHDRRHGRALLRPRAAAADARPHAPVMTSTPKVVVSTTLEDPAWGPTTVIRSDVTAELTKLKQQPGGDITVGASGTLVRFLLTEGLLDELRLLVHPIVVGTGKHLFEGGDGPVPLNLAEARPHRNGVVALRYTRAD